jgi:hypothetical protein
MRGGYLSLAGFALIIGLSLAFAGCIAGEDTASPDSTSAHSAQGDEELGTWNVSDEVSVRFLVGASPGPTPVTDGVFVTTGCERFSIDVPSGTDRIVFHVSTSTIDPSRPGTGYTTVEVTPPSGDGSRHPSGRADTSQEQVIAVEDPAPGEWAARVLPRYLTANQVHELTVELGGPGSAPPSTPGLQTNC